MPGAIWGMAYTSWATAPTWTDWTLDTGGLELMAGVPGYDGMALDEMDDTRVWGTGGPTEYWTGRHRGEGNVWPPKVVKPAYVTWGKAGVESSGTERMGLSTV